MIQLRLLCFSWTLATATALSALLAPLGPLGPLDAIGAAVLDAGRHRERAVLIRVFCEVGQAEPGLLLLVVRPHQPLAVSSVAANAVAAKAAAGLHADAGLDAGDHVGAHSIGASTAAQASTIRIGARKVEQIDTSECNEEAANQRQGVNRIGRVEAAKEDERGTQSSRRKGDVVERVDTKIK